MKNAIPKIIIRAVLSCPLLSEWNVEERGAPEHGRRGGSWVFRILYPLGSVPCPVFACNCQEEVGWYLVRHEVWRCSGSKGGFKELEQGRPGSGSPDHFFAGGGRGAGKEMMLFSAARKLERPMPTDPQSRSSTLLCSLGTRGWSESGIVRFPPSSTSSTSNYTSLLTTYTDSASTYYYSFSHLYFIWFRQRNLYGWRCEGYSKFIYGKEKVWFPFFFHIHFSC